MWFHAGGGVDFCDGWRTGLVTAEGEIITYAGWRHKEPAYWDGQHVPELVGDWSRVSGPKGMREAWDFGWIPDSIRVDPDLVIREGIKGGHPNNPAMLVCDSQNNRVLLVTFDRHFLPGEKPPVVEEFATGLLDPWGLYITAGGAHAVIGERHGNRLGLWHIASGTLTRYLVDDSAHRALISEFGGATSSRFADNARKHPPKTSREVLRSHDLIWPEGMDGLVDDDGREWVYVASSAMAQVLRFDVATGERQVMIPATRTGAFLSLTVCRDDSVYPKGTMLVSNWYNHAEGFPDAYGPGGATLPGVLRKGGDLIDSRGGLYPHMAYGAASCVGKWGIAFSGSYEGLIKASVAVPGDPTVDFNRFHAGAAKWRRHRPFHGDYGFAFHRGALPWGADADVDYYLESSGHQRPVPS
jgi:hypothetical protein